MGNCLGRVTLREKNEILPRLYLWKGRGCAQWSGSPPLPPGEQALPLAPMADTQEFGTDTSSAAEHPPCSSTDGNTCWVGMWGKRVRTTWEMGSSFGVPNPINSPWAAHW